MRRLILTLIAAITCAATLQPAPQSLQAQTANKLYRSETLGFTFQHPADWEVQVTEATQTVVATTKDDLTQIQSGAAPSGLIFSITMTSFRQVGAKTPDDFPAVLQKVAASEAQAASVRVGNAPGSALELVDLNANIASSTMAVATGGRRVALIRGVASAQAWESVKSQFNDMIGSITFFSPESVGDLDSLGMFLWATPADQYPDLRDLSISPDGTRLNITAGSAGIWEVQTNGVPGTVRKFEEITEYAGIAALRDGRIYIADPASNALYETNREDGNVRRILGGQIGTGRGTFGAGSPRTFAFGLQGLIYVLDENEGGTRIQVFNRAGGALTFWDVTAQLGVPTKGAQIATDQDGNVYIVGADTNGIAIFNAAGAVRRKNIGALELTDLTPLAITVDRYDNMIVATDEGGILKFAPDGSLTGVIGVPYDQAAPPKPGQIGRPVGLVVTTDGSTLYVADVGKYPQILAFSLDNNPEINLDAGTQRGEIIYGQSVTGTITQQTFNYVYTFRGRTGDVVTITMKADTANGGQLDTFVDLLNVERVRVAQNDDIGANTVPGLSATDSQIKSFTLPAGGTYTIRATRFGRETATAVGSFTLTLEAVE